MSVSVRVRGAGNSARGHFVVSAEAVGAEWGSELYTRHYSYTESATLGAGFNWVVAEAGLAGFAPEFATLSPLGFDFIIEVS